MTDGEKLLKKMVLSYELFKNQTYVERLMKEGEVQGYKKIISIYNAAIEQGNEIDKSLFIILQTKIQVAQEELQVLKAQENILNKMNQDLENNLSTMDISLIIEENIKNNKYPKDVQARIKAGFCALKRPGKGGFTCKQPIVNGTKYCKEHLEKYDKLAFVDLFTGKDNE
jgi:hypothetical protein